MEARLAKERAELLPTQVSALLAEAATQANATLLNFVQGTVSEAAPLPPTLGNPCSAVSRACVWD